MPIAGKIILILPINLRYNAFYLIQI